MQLIEWFSFTAVALFFFAGPATCQVHTSLASLPAACRDTAGDVDLSYKVRHRIVNATSKALNVKLGRDRNEIFMLFTSEKSTKPEDAIFQYNPDSVSSPSVVVHRLPANKALVWYRTVHILSAGHDVGATGLPTPGRYFLVVFPDVQMMAKKGNNAGPEQFSDFLPVDIPSTPPAVGLCKKHS